MLPDEEASVAQVRRRYASAFIEMTRTLDAVLQMVTANHWVLQPQVREAFEMRVIRIAQILLAKSCKTYRAVQIVCEYGLGQDAGVLSRTLFETMLQVLWMFERDASKRARLILAHEAQRSLVQLNELEQLGALDADELELSRAASHEHLALAREGLSDDEWNSIRYHWGGGVFNLCRDLQHAHPGLPLVYSAVYRTTSGYAHGADLAAHAFISNDDDFIIRLSPGDYELDRIPRLARHILITTAGEINEKLALGFDEAIDHVRPPSVT